MHSKLGITNAGLLEELFQIAMNVFFIMLNVFIVQSAGWRTAGDQAVLLIYSEENWPYISSFLDKRSYEKCCQYNQ